MESPKVFRLLGSLVGLAVYNSVILDVSFPMAFYRKLLGRPVGLRDLADVHPATAGSLQQVSSATMIHACGGQ